MLIIAKIIIPIITVFIIVYGLYKKVPLYDEFVNGVKEGLTLSLEIFPSIFAMIIAVTVLVTSNLLLDIT